MLTQCNHACACSVCVSGLGGPSLYHEARDAGVPLVAGQPTASLQEVMPPTPPVAPNDAHLSPPVPRRLQSQFTEVASQVTVPNPDDVPTPSVPTPKYEHPKNEGMGPQAPVVKGPSSTVQEVPATPNDSVEVVEPPILPDNQLGDSQVVSGAASPEQEAPPLTPQTLMDSQFPDGQEVPETPAGKTPVETPVETPCTADTGRKKESRDQKLQTTSPAKRKTAPKPQPKSSSTYADGSYWKTLI